MPGGYFLNGKAFPPLNPGGGEKPPPMAGEDSAPTSGVPPVAEALMNREPVYSQTGQRLNSRDAAMKRHLDFRPPNDESNAMAQDLNPGNITELAQQMARYRPGSPQRLLLEQEMARIKDMASNLLGPINPEPIPGMIGSSDQPYTQNPVLRLPPGVQRVPPKRYY